VLGAEPLPQPLPDPFTLGRQRYVGEARVLAALAPLRLAVSHDPHAGSEGRRSIGLVVAHPDIVGDRPPPRLWLAEDDPPDAAVVLVPLSLSESDEQPASTSMDAAVAAIAARRIAFEFRTMDSLPVCV